VKVLGYEKSTVEPTITLVSYATQLQALNKLGIEVDTNHYNQSQKKKLVTLLIIIAISLQMTLCVVGVVGVLVRTHDAPLKSFRELKLKVGQSTQLLPVLQVYFRFDQDDFFHVFS